MQCKSALTVEGMPRRMIGKGSDHLFMVGFEGGFQLSVEAFYHSIGSWMVRGGVDLLDAKEHGEMGEQRRFKLGTSIIVMVEGTRKAEIQCVTTAQGTDSAVMSVRGTASGQ